MISARAKDRPSLIHGGAIGYARKKETLSVTLGRLLQPKNKPRQPPLTITVAEINRITKRVIAVGDRLLDILEAIKDRCSTGGKRTYR
jgi:hypothetical protein